MIRFAYPLSPLLMGEPQVIGGPAWIDSSFFTVEAKAEDPSATTFELREMVQTLLTEEFKLTFHRETRDRRGYVLVPAQGGLKLKESAGPATAMPRLLSSSNSSARPLVVPNSTLTNFAVLLSLMMKTAVVDRTGAQGSFDIILYSAETGDETGGSIFTALQEQLGLKLEAQRKIPFDFIIIDHAEKPAEER